MYECNILGDVYKCLVKSNVFLLFQDTNKHKKYFDILSQLVYEFKNLYKIQKNVFSSHVFNLQLSSYLVGLVSRYLRAWLKMFGNKKTILCPLILKDVFMTDKCLFHVEFTHLVIHT